MPPLELHAPARDTLPALDPAAPRQYTKAVALPYAVLALPVIGLRHAVRLARPYEYLRDHFAVTVPTRVVKFTATLTLVKSRV